MFLELERNGSGEEIIHEIVMKGAMSESSSSSYRDFLRVFFAHS